MGGAFTPRTEAQKAAIPMPADATVALVAATCASISVAPFLMCVDRGVVAAAAGNAPGGSLFRAIGAVAGEFVTKPKVAFGQPAVWIVAAVYGGTYFAKNFADVLIERRGLSESRAAGTAKFCATTATNMGGSILKDAAFARWFGAAAAAAAAPAVIPKTSYALFAARDCLTISGAFVVPDAMRAALHARAGVAESAAGVVSQLVSPPLMQVVCTPLHLLALNLVNVPAASAAARVAALRASTPAALLARSLRMLPAYGVGGLLNAVVTAKGRDVVAAVFAGVPTNVWDTRWVRCRSGAFGRKTSAAGAASSAGRFQEGVAWRALREGAARVSLPGPTRVPPKFANITHATGVAAVPIQTTVQVTEVEDAARGSGNGRGGMGGAERTVSTKEVVGGGRGGGAEHLRAVGEVGGRAARERRGRMTRDSRVAGSFDAFVDARRRRPRTSKISRVRVIKHQQNPS